MERWGAAPEMQREAGWPQPQPGIAMHSLQLLDHRRQNAWSAVVLYASMDRCALSQWRAGQSHPADDGTP